GFRFLIAHQSTPKICATERQHGAFQSAVPVRAIEHRGGKLCDQVGNRYARKLGMIELANVDAFHAPQRFQNLAHRRFAFRDCPYFGDDGRTASPARVPKRGASFHPEKQRGESLTAPNRPACLGRGGQPPKNTNGIPISTSFSGKRIPSTKSGAPNRLQSFRACAAIRKPRMRTSANRAQAGVLDSGAALTMWAVEAGLRRLPQDALAAACTLPAGHFSRKGTMDALDRIGCAVRGAPYGCSQSRDISRLRCSCGYVRWVGGFDARATRARPEADLRYRPEPCQADRSRSAWRCCRAAWRARVRGIFRWGRHAGIDVDRHRAAR